MDSTERFFNMINKVPAVATLWDKDKRQLKTKAFEEALNVFSSGEITMALFFAAVWLHSNQQYGFDVVRAVDTLDNEKRAIIIAWLMDPFYP